MSDPDFGTVVPPDGPAAVRDEADSIMSERDPQHMEDTYNGDEIEIPEDETEETEPEPETDEG